MAKFRSEKLTTCRVAADGGGVGLEFLDSSGNRGALELPVEQAESLIMALPRDCWLVRCASEFKMPAVSSGSASGRPNAPRVKPA